MRRFLAVLGMMTALTPLAHAQEALPPAVRLEGLTMVYQDINRCAAAALTIHLSYWVEEPVNYHEIIARLNPNASDLSVRIEEMIQVAGERYGLLGVVRRGGSIELLKTLVAAGFPVLVENTYFDGPSGTRDWMSHNRVLMGYDDARQELYFFDSLLGSGPDGRGRPMTYADFDARWLAFNRNFLVLYPPERAATLQLLLGDLWDEQAAARLILAQSARDLEQATTRADRAFIHLNMAYAHHQLGELELAVQQVDAARALNALPWRYFWYEFTPLAIYLAAGRYDDVMTLVSATLASLPGSVEELYYYAGRVAERRGDTTRAMNNYRAAIRSNLYFSDAIDALSALERTLRP